MANRFWVASGGIWNATAGSKWATTSGGTGGASVPTSSDNVFFDANSGSGAVTITGSQQCLSINCTGYTGSLTGSELDISGNITLSSSMVSTGTLTFVMIRSGTIITAGQSIFGLGMGDGATGMTCTVGDDIVITSFMQINNGIFNSNNKNITTPVMFSFGGGTLILGNGTWTLTGTGIDIGLTGPWNPDNFGSLTITANNSTIKLTDSSASDKAFNGGNRTYNNITFSGTGTGAYIITGNNIFNNLAAEFPPHTIKFVNGTVQTITSLSLDGSSNNLITLQSTNVGAKWNISTTESSIVTDHISLQDCNASNGASWLARYSINGGNNSGWRFASGEMISFFF